MLYSDLLVRSAAYRASVLQRSDGDGPFAVQQCGTSKKMQLEACKQCVEAGAACIDLNFGCPLLEGKYKRFGSFMLESAYDRNVIVETVAYQTEFLTIPITCKIRVLPEPIETIAFCQRLELAGVASITIHGRQRGIPKQQRFSPVYLDIIKAVKSVVNIPVIMNGLVSSVEDIQHNQQYTNADGIMQGESVLSNVQLLTFHLPYQKENIPFQARKSSVVVQEPDDGFVYTYNHNIDVEEQKQAKLTASLRAWHDTKKDIWKEGPNVRSLSQDSASYLEIPDILRTFESQELHLTQSGLHLSIEYLELAITHQTDLLWVKGHLRWMCSSDMHKYQIRDDVEAAENLQDIMELLQKGLVRKDSGCYIFDPALQKSFEENKMDIQRKRKNFIHRSVYKKKKTIYKDTE